MDLRVSQPGRAERGFGFSREKFPFKLDVPALGVLRIGVVFTYARAVALRAFNPPGRGSSPRGLRRHIQSHVLVGYGPGFCMAHHPCSNHLLRNCNTLLVLLEASRTATNGLPISTSEASRQARPPG